MPETFPRVAWWSRGYHAAQVEEFLARARRAYEQPLDAAPVLTPREVRTAGFDLVRHGYDVAAVDAALDRLEDALADRLRRRTDRGAGAREQREVAAVLPVLRARLERPDGGRFPRGSGWECTYDPADVDELCARLQSTLAPQRVGVLVGAAGGAGDGHGGSPTPWGTTPDEVRRAVFRRRRGSRGYRESAVDAYLDRVVDVLLASR